MIHTTTEGNGGVEELKDVTVHSPETCFHGVKAAHVEPRPWIDAFPVCPPLDQYHIVHVGLMEAVPPTRIVRTRQTTTYFLATHAGRGKVLVDGEWRISGPGSACLLPAHTLNAFRAIPGVKWEFSWACYDLPSDQRPLSDSISPVLSEYDSTPFYAAVTGLIFECHHAAQPSAVQGWVDLIHTYVLRFARPLCQDDRLRMLWERVAATLSDDWNLARLTRESGYSREHLRRLCQSHLGRGPMHQVTNLRMRKAAALLGKTGKTIEAIAIEVGYQNAFVFSNAFKKWIGWRPSEYRHKSSGTAHPVPDRPRDKH